MRAAFEHDTTAVISTNSDLGRVLKSMSGPPLVPTKTAESVPVALIVGNKRLSVPRILNKGVVPFDRRNCRAGAPACQDGMGSTGRNACPTTGVLGSW